MLWEDHLYVEKMVGPVTRLTFLGIEVDTGEIKLRLPAENLKKLRKLVAEWRLRKGCRKRDLHSLAGYLSHACKSSEAWSSFFERNIRPVVSV